ncbi:MAG: glycosyltransferase family 1 protein [Candidatus Saccharibacteria bacterium]|nr:glycosyltransferase family 1 protein [Candidatus Saccharibacteria bacterium]
MANKKIFFDGLPLVDGHFSGVGQYNLGILRGLDAILERDYLAGKQTPEIYVIIPRDRIPQFINFGFKHIRLKKFPLNFVTMSRLWRYNLLPPIDLLMGRGFYVFTRFVDMRLAFSKSSIVVYDLSYESHKEYAEDRNAKFLSEGVRRSLKRASRVFTISKNSKREVNKFYDFPSEKIAISTPAADQNYFYHRSDKEIVKVKQKYGIKKDYILSLSNLEPRKNLDTLVDAYCALPKSYRENVSLLLVGVSGWKTDALFQKIIELVKQGYDIVRPNEYISDQDKPAVLSGAKMLVYPSHYEGFGMPPLEALACGTPVITSDNSSIPEVVGDAGVMLDCKDVSGFTKTMKQYLDDSEKTEKRALVQGLERARHFNWEKSAQVYLDEILETMK